MTSLFINAAIDDNERRKKLYKGDLFLYTPNEHSRALINLARGLVEEAFQGLDPQTAQHEMPVDAFADILKKLKPNFIHHPDCKRIIPAMLASHGCDLSQTYFDVPRMRSSTSNDYLTTGIAYAFHAHRDTWYSAPMSQINWWIPIYPIGDDNAMEFHLKYWDVAVENNSEIYNYQEWNNQHRFNLNNHLNKDERPQPKAQVEIEREPNLVVVAEPGSMLLFSAAHLHSSIPNTSGKTRFSIDFRVVHRGDLDALAGAPNMDSKCTGSAINDYLQGATLEHLPESTQKIYMPGHPQPLVGSQRSVV